MKIPVAMPTFEEQSASVSALAAITRSSIPPGGRDLRKADQLLYTRVLSSPGDHYSANYWMTATEPSFIP